MLCLFFLTVSYCGITEGSGVGVIVLFPEHGISEVQRLQMTAMSGGNVQVLGETM